MIIRRPELRLKLARILAKLMNLPAPDPDESHVGSAAPSPAGQEGEA